GLVFPGVEQGPAPGKTVFNPVPISNGLLSIAPAEKNDFFPERAWKVDQPLLYSLADTAQIVNLLDQFVKLFDGLRNARILLKLFHEISALRVQLIPAHRAAAAPAEQFDALRSPCHQRLQNGKQPVGFLYCEEARINFWRCHGYVSLAQDTTE